MKVARMLAGAVVAGAVIGGSVGVADARPARHTQCWMFERAEPSPSTIHCNNGAHNPRAGDRFDFIMSPEGDTGTRCADMGGHLVHERVRGYRWTVCIGIDF